MLIFWQKIRMFIHTSIYILDTDTYLDRDRNESRPEWNFCNFASSLTGPAELLLQYNEIYIEISLGKKPVLHSVLLSMRLLLFEKGISFCPMGDQFESI